MEVNKEWATAGELMVAGKWKHRKYFRKGVGGVHYYISEVPGGYRVSRMYALSLVGVVTYRPLKLLCQIGRVLFNLFGKGIGNEVFDELVEEINELLLARKHNLSTGNAFSSDRLNSIEECDEYIAKHIESL